MRIALISSNGTQWLAGNPAVSESVHSSAANYQISSTAQQPVIPLIRAASALHLDRGNLSTSIIFSTTRKFSSIAEAETWMNSYDAIAERKGTLVLVSQLSDGGTTSRYMTGAVVAPPQRRQEGVSIDLSYSVRGNIISDNDDGSLTMEPWEDLASSWEFIH